MKEKISVGNFLICLLLSMLFNILWTIPAFILLVCHYIFHISIWWFWGALILWFVGQLFWLFFIRWSASCAKEPKPQLENANPYSKTNEQVFPAKKEDNE